MFYKIVQFLLRCYFAFLTLFDKNNVTHSNGNVHTVWGLSGKNVFYTSSEKSIERRVRHDLNQHGTIYYRYDGQQQIVMIGNYTMAQQYYACNTVIREYNYLGYVYQTLLKNCIGSSYGKEWIAMRKPLHEFFTSSAINKKSDILKEEINGWIDELNIADESFHKLNEMKFDKLVLKIMSIIVYGNLTEDKLDELYELYQSHSKVMYIMSSDLLLRVPLLYSNIDTENKRLVNEFKNNWRQFNLSIRDNVNEESLFYKMLNCEIYNGEDKLLQTLYEVMLFNADIMMDAFINLFRNLSLYDEVRVKTYEDEDYLINVINESARLNPGITQTFSETLTEQLVLKDYTGTYKLPAGTKVSIDTEMLNRDITIWDNPDKFIPERFDNNNIKVIHRFGLSNRKCLGNVLADHILKITISTFLERYDFKMSKSNFSTRNSISNISGYHSEDILFFTTK